MLLLWCSLSCDDVFARAPRAGACSEPSNEAALRMRALRVKMVLHALPPREVRRPYDPCWRLLTQLKTDPPRDSSCAGGSGDPLRQPGALQRADYRTKCEDAGLSFCDSRVSHACDSGLQSENSASRRITRPLALLPLRLTSSVYDNVAATVSLTATLAETPSANERCSL